MKKLVVLIFSGVLLYANYHPSMGNVYDSFNPNSYQNQQLNMQRQQLNIQQQQLQMQQQQQEQQMRMQQQQLYQQQQMQQQTREMQANQYKIQQQDAKIKEYERIYKTERKEKQLDQCIKNMSLIIDKGKKASTKSCFDYMDASK